MLFRSSQVVLDELMEGEYPGQHHCLDLVRPLPLLRLTDEILEIAEIYQQERVMPAPPSADALHVAIAAYYRVEYLLTWNCRHLANARKTRHLETINLRLRIPTPRLVTPHNLQLTED